MPPKPSATSSTKKNNSVHKTVQNASSISKLTGRPSTRSQMLSTGTKVQELARSSESVKKRIRILEQVEGKDMLTPGDAQELSDLRKTLQSYNKIDEQANIQNTSTTAAHDTTVTDAPEQDKNTRIEGQEVLQNQNQAVRTTVEDVDMQESKPTVKDEPCDDPAPPTKMLKDDMNIFWNVDVVRGQVLPFEKGHSEEVVGYQQLRSTMRYLVRKGDPTAYTFAWDSTLPTGADYKKAKSVTLRGERIIEQIVQLHRDKNTQPPIDILSKAQILFVYWDKKTGLGHSTDLTVLAPDYPRRRPAIRCYTYLDPELYKEKYPHITNVEGFSHETMSVMKPYIGGHDSWGKSITLYNMAARMENKYEAKFLKKAPGRPGPHSEIIDDEVDPIRRVTRRSTMRRLTPHSEIIDDEVYPVRRSTPRRSTPRRQQTTAPLSPPSSGGWSSPPPATQQNKMSSNDALLNKQFLQLTLELNELSIDGSYKDLPPAAQKGYLAEREAWRHQMMENERKDREEDEN